MPTSLWWSPSLRAPQGVLPQPLNRDRVFTRDEGGSASSVGPGLRATHGGTTPTNRSQLAVPYQRSRCLRSLARALLFLHLLGAAFEKGEGGDFVRMEARVRPRPALLHHLLPEGNERALKVGLDHSGMHV